MEPDRRFNFFFSPPAHLHCMCLHIYNWNIVACDVKQPIYLSKQKDVRTRQNFDFGKEQKIQHFFIHVHAFRSLLCIWFVAVAFQPEEGVFEEGDPSNLFWPRPGSAPGRIWSTVTLVRDLEYIMHITFQQNPSSGSVAKADCIPIHIHAIVHPSLPSPK